MNNNLYLLIKYVKNIAYFKECVKLFHMLIIAVNFYNTKNRKILLILKVNSNTILDLLIIIKVKKNMNKLISYSHCLISYHNI